MAQMDPTGQVGSILRVSAQIAPTGDKSDNRRKVGKPDRNALLAAFPDIASMLDKLEQGEQRPALARSPLTGTKRAPASKWTKRVQGGAGYKSYTALDWGKLASKPRTTPLSDKEGVVVSKGRRRRKRH